MLVSTAAGGAVTKHGLTGLLVTSSTTLGAVLAGADLVALITGCLTVLVGAIVKVLSDKTVRADAYQIRESLEQELNRVISELAWHRSELKRLYAQINTLEEINDRERARRYDALLWAKRLRHEMETSGQEPIAKPPSWMGQTPQP